MSSENRKRRRVESMPSSCDSFSVEEGVSGVIQNVTIKNFMCHEHLSVNFNEKINLVQGRNGSGKSAILSAVVVALGGSTRTTNRGSSLKDLIKYDKHTATVQVVLTNEGREAFKPETYGNAITIERKLTSTGTSSYAIKAANGTLVSQKKEELKRMCDYFNLNVENPITVLNQDMSRSFLHSADPHNLYKFFYEATQLQQMTDYYEQLQQYLTYSKNLLDNQKACMPIIEKEVQELQNRQQRNQRRIDKMERLRVLRRELFWAKFSEREAQKIELEEKVLELSEFVRRIKTEQTSSDSQLAHAKKQHKELQSQLHNLSQQVEGERLASKQKGESVTRLKAVCKDLRREIERDKRKISQYDNDIESLKEVMLKDNSEAVRKWEEFNQRVQEEQAQLQAQLAEVEQLKNTEDTHLINIQNTRDVKLSDRQQLQFEDNMKRRNIQDCEQELKTLQSQQNDAFTIFGQWVPQLLRKIEAAFRQGRFSQRPVGPLGAYIEMRDSQWTHIAEMVIGARISAFVVNCSQDEKVLRELFQGINFRSNLPVVICCRFRPRHSAEAISKFEVKSPKYPSLWSLMHIKSDVVANVLLDRFHVESIMLITTAAEAGQILKSKETVPVNCKVCYTLNGDKYFPDPNYKVYSGTGQRVVRYLQVSVKEREQEVKNNIASLREQVEGLRVNLENLGRDLHDIQEQEKLSTQKIQGHRKSIQTLRVKLTQVSNRDGPPPPPNVSDIEEDIKEQERRRIVTRERVTELEEKVKAADDEFRKSSEEYQKFDETRKESLENAKKIEEEMTKVAEECNNFVKNADSFKKKLKSQEVKLKEYQNEILSHNRELEKAIEMIDNFQPRMETRRLSRDIERQYKALEDKLQEEQEREGDPVAIANQFRDKSEKFLKMKRELEESKNLVKKLERSLQERWNKGKHFRKTLSILVKTGFSEALTTKNLKGKILFDFEKELLTIEVTKLDGYLDQIENSNNISNKKTLKRGQQEKLSMMSGGERSFATVALILSLWGVIESPVRILDEFDVFMDIIARRQSLDMMISHAKPKTQYIYLTPLEVDQSKHTAKLNVFRMRDPERESSQQ